MSADVKPLQRVKVTRAHFGFEGIVTAVYRAPDGTPTRITVQSDTGRRDTFPLAIYEIEVLADAPAPQYRKGQRIRHETSIVHEGVIKKIQDTYLEILADDGMRYGLQSSDSDVTKVKIDVLAEPEPEWKNGQVIDWIDRITGERDIRLHRIADEWLTAGGIRISDERVNEHEREGLIRKVEIANG
jgi:hypothetical protein